jgi:hypothetical protein
MLSVRFEFIAAGSERKGITDGGQYVLDRPTCLRVIENLCGGSEGKPIALRPLT